MPLNNAQRNILSVYNNVSKTHNSIKQGDRVKLWYSCDKHFLMLFKHGNGGTVFLGKTEINREEYAIIWSKENETASLFSLSGQNSIEKLVIKNG